MSNPISRRSFIKTGALAAVGLATSGIQIGFPRSRFDLIIKNATIFDGTGGLEWQADLGITGDEITAIGQIDPAQGKTVLQIKGWHICPGFIDIHSHSDGAILVYPTAESRVLQGITTEITGNCGYSAAPLTGVDAEKRRQVLLEEDDIRADWSDVASYFEQVQTTGIAINHALLLGQGTLRRNRIGLVDRRLTEDELKDVLRAVEEGMDQGAIGLSTGLEYTPGSYTPTDEIIAMTRVVARHGGLYASHIRNEEDGLLEAVNEAIEIGRQSGARVEISHLKAAGQLNWHKQTASLELIESARRDGVEVLADAYPYTAYSTGLSIFLEDWVREGGSEAAIERLTDPVQRARIRKEVDERVHRDLGDYNLIVISRVLTDSNQNKVGKNMSEIAGMWDLEPVDALLRLLVEEKASVGFIGHGMSPENVEMVLSHPLVMIGSDGSSMAPVGRAAQTRPHPRSYGTCPRVLGYYARERQIFNLATAIKKMTTMPADQAGLQGRGRIAPGMKADLVIFDAKTVKDRATFEKPHQYPSGIEYVLVNGQVVVKQGKHTGTRPGQVLRT